MGPFLFIVLQMKAWFEQRHAPAPGTYLCQSGGIEECQVKEFRFGGDSPFAFRLFIYNDAGEFRAFRNSCPHYDVPLNHIPGDVFTTDHRYFLCSTHFAKFEKDSGLCVEGPCSGTALEPIPLQRKGDDLLIGGSQS